MILAWVLLVFFSLRAWFMVTHIVRGNYPRAIDGASPGQDLVSLIVAVLVIVCLWQLVHGAA